MAGPDHIRFQIVQQESCIQFISQAFDKLIQVGIENISRQRILTRQDALKEQWSLIVTNHNAIQLAVSRLDTASIQNLLLEPYFSEKLYSTTHEIYLETLEKIQILLESAQHSSNIVSTPNPSEIAGSQQFIFPTSNSPRLPRISIPQFSGTLSEWLSYKNLFTSLVLQNLTLSSIEKLQYLKSSLIGPAASLLQNTPLTAENFSKSWELLVSFYENRRILVNDAVHSLFSLKRINKESSSELEALYTSITQIYQTLETLGRPVDKWDDILIYMMVQRLDQDSIKIWEQHLGASKEPPTWSTFREFLYSRMTSLQAFENAQISNLPEQPSRRQARSLFSSTAQSSPGAANNQSDRHCPLCSSNHHLFTCQTYLKKPVDKRKEFISTNRLCYNCLGSHRVAMCRSLKRCQICGRRHNTSLHQKIQLSEPKPLHLEASSKSSPSNVVATSHNA